MDNIQPATLLDFKMIKQSESLPNLLDSAKSGESTSPEMLKQAKVAHATLKRVKGVLRTAIVKFGNGEQVNDCANCSITCVGKVSAVHITLCDIHCDGGNEVQEGEWPQCSGQDRNARVLKHLISMYGENMIKRCAECKIEISGFRNKLDQGTMDPDTLGNGSSMVFVICHMEEIY